MMFNFFADGSLLSFFNAVGMKLHEVSKTVPKADADEIQEYFENCCNRFVGNPLR